MILFCLLWNVLLVGEGSSSNLAAEANSSSPNQKPTRKRKLPGNPDPNAEVVALSPKTLLATNRFFCDICQEGFKREQNLLLHKNTHAGISKISLQRSSGSEIQKKVYICPELACVYNNPERALSDITSIKKHFVRKHVEKKLKCNKCSKVYALQADLKAHSNICGTVEYRCNCGTIFYRKNSFVAHRDMCVALSRPSAIFTDNNNITHRAPTHQPTHQTLPPIFSSPPPHHHNQFLVPNLILPTPNPRPVLNPPLSNPSDHLRIEPMSLPTLNYSPPSTSDTFEKAFYDMMTPYERYLTYGDGKGGTNTAFAAGRLGNEGHT